MRSRGLKPGFFKNEDLARLPPLTRILFAGLWGLADREGRLEDRPKQIKAEILPYDDCNVDAMLAELSVASTDDKPFIVRWSVNHRSYLWIPSFLDHQNPHYKEEPSKIPPYAGTFIIELSLADDKPIIEPSLSYEPGHGCTLTPDSGLLTPDSKEEKRERTSRVAKADGSTDWTAAWIEAREKAKQAEPTKTERAIFGRKVKEIAGLDPDTMQDTIVRMIAEDKPPGVLGYVYDDCKRAGERELDQVNFGGGRRVR